MGTPSVSHEVMLRERHALMAGEIALRRPTCRGRGGSATAGADCRGRWTTQGRTCPRARHLAGCRARQRWRAGRGRWCPDEPEQPGGHSSSVRSGPASAGVGRQLRELVDRERPCWAPPGPARWLRGSPHPGCCLRATSHGTRTGRCSGATPRKRRRVALGWVGDRAAGSIVPSQPNLRSGAISEVGAFRWPRSPSTPPRAPPRAPAPSAASGRGQGPRRRLRPGRRPDHRHRRLAGAARRARHRAGPQRRDPPRHRRQHHADAGEGHAAPPRAPQRPPRRLHPGRPRQDRRRRGADLPRGRGRGRHPRERRGRPDPHVAAHHGQAERHPVRAHRRHLHPRDRRLAARQRHRAAGRRHHRRRSRRDRRHRPARHVRATLPRPRAPKGEGPRAPRARAPRARRRRGRRGRRRRRRRRAAEGGDEG